MGREKRGAAATATANGGKVKGRRECKPAVRGKGAPRLGPFSNMPMLLQPRLNAGVEDGEVIIELLRKAEGVDSTLGEKAPDGGVKRTRREVNGRGGGAGGIARHTLEEGMRDSTGKVRGDNLRDGGVHGGASGVQAFKTCKQLGGGNACKSGTLVRQGVAADETTHKRVEDNLRVGAVMGDVACGLTPEDTIHCEADVTVHMRGANLGATAIANEVGIVGGEVQRVRERTAVHGAMVASLTDGEADGTGGGVT